MWRTSGRRRCGWSTNIFCMPPTPTGSTEGRTTTRPSAARRIVEYESFLTTPPHTFRISAALRRLGSSFCIPFVEYSALLLGLLKRFKRAKAFNSNLFNGPPVLLRHFIYAPETHHTPRRTGPSRGDGRGFGRGFCVVCKFSGYDIWIELL